MSKSSTKTVIEFKYLKAAGIRIGNSDGSGKTFGNFYPTHKQIATTVPGMAGNVWVESIDFEKLHKIELDQETIRPLPAHILQDQDDATRSTYKARVAEEAANAHHQNNKIRDELYHYQDLGYITIVSDSFLDELNKTVKPVVKTTEKNANS